MDLLARYLQAVRFFLPQAQQDDIVRELSENLISQMEDRQEELGRPLNEAEQAEILRRHGHPMLVAGRYRSQQHLIGPVFFPIYLFALKAGLGIALLVTAVVATVAVVLDGDPVRQAVHAMLAFPGRGLMVFAWTTLSFAALDIARAHFRISHDWDPRSLPNVVKTEYRIPRTRTLCELFLLSASLVWLLLVPHAPFLLLGPAAAVVEGAPIWRLVYVPILLVTVATAALQVMNYLRPYWTTARSVGRLALNGAGLVVLAVLLRAGELFVPRSAGAALPDGVRVEHLVDIINASFQIGFAVAGIISLIEIGRELHRLKARRNVSFPSDSAAAPHAGH